MHRFETNERGEKEIVLWDENDPFAEINELHLLVDELESFIARFGITEFDDFDDLANKADEAWVDFECNHEKYDDGSNPTIPCFFTQDYDELVAKAAEIVAACRK